MYYSKNNSEQRNKSQHEVEQLIGKRFGILTVLDVHSTGKGRVCKCVCDCGNAKTVYKGNLISGGTQSCGCKRRSYENLVGKIFGRLTVCEYSHKRPIKNIKGWWHYWRCLCECGKPAVVEGNQLRSGTTQSCGCLQRERTITTCTKHGLRPKNGTYNPAYEKLRRRDPCYRLRKNCRAMVYQSLRKAKHSKMGQSFFKHVPYTVEQLRQHLESQFDEHMSWNNYGPYWHIDHIIPQSSFEYSSMQDKRFIECWSLENLQPLEKTANLRKGSNLLCPKQNIPHDH